MQREPGGQAHAHGLSRTGQMRPGVCIGPSFLLHIGKSTVVPSAGHQLPKDYVSSLLDNLNSRPL